MQIFGNPFIVSFSSRYIDLRSFRTTHLVLIIRQQVETAELISYTDIHCCRGINTSSLSPTTIYSQAGAGAANILALSVHRHANYVKETLL